VNWVKVGRCVPPYEKSTTSIEVHRSCLQLDTLRSRVYFPARQSRKADDNLHRPSPTYSLLERRKLHSRVRERVRCQSVSPPAVINLSQLTRVVASVGLLLECAEQFVIIPSTSSVDLSTDHNRDWRWHGGVA